MKWKQNYKTNIQSKRLHVCCGVKQRLFFLRGINYAFFYIYIYIYYLVIYFTMVQFAVVAPIVLQWTSAAAWHVWRVISAYGPKPDHAAVHFRATYDAKRHLCRCVPYKQNHPCPALKYPTPESQGHDSNPSHKPAILWGWEWCHWSWS